MWQLSYGNYISYVAIIIWQLSYEAIIIWQLSYVANFMRQISTGKYMANIIHCRYHMATIIYSYMITNIIWQISYGNYHMANITWQKLPVLYEMNGSSSTKHRKHISLVELEVILVYSCCYLAYLKITVIVISTHQVCFCRCFGTNHV